MITLYNNDCLEILKTLPEKSIDMVLVDLPYGQTSCKWDCLIDLDEMWKQLKKCCKKECNYIFFCTTKFGYQLIKSNEKWFRYDLVWKKSRKVGFLSANKMPLRQHEMIYIFCDSANSVDWNLPLHKYQKLKDYSKYLLNNIKIIDKKLKNLRFFKSDKKDFCLLREETYNKLIDTYEIDKLKYFKPFKELKKLWNDEKNDKNKKNENINIYNPQKTKGKPYKVNDRNAEIYGGRVKGYENKTGDRHPTSIIEHEMIYVFGDDKSKKGNYNPQKIELDKIDKRKRNINKEKIPETYGNGELPKESNYTHRHPTSIIEKQTILDFKNPHKTLHRTQKPVDLCEWLIKSYSNEGDIILDFTMGSGTSGIACLNTKRKFIGIEKDNIIFKIAQKRIKELKH